MHFSKTVLMVLTGTATASSYLPELNSTELGAVLVGASPVITEITTVTEHLVVISMRTPRYMWLNKPVPLTRVQTSSAISEEQIRRRGPLRVHRPFITSLPSAPAMLSGTTLVRVRKHRSTTLASEPAASQRTTTTELCGATMHPKTLKLNVLFKSIMALFGFREDTCQILVSQHNATIENQKAIQGGKSMLQIRSMDWHSSLEITAGIQAIQTINPTWSVSSKKWHGPHSHPEATATICAPLEDVPVITAAAFKA